MDDTRTKADRISNRAPRGGAISTVNGRFYLGGQFMPMVAAIVEFKPTPLAGSHRQVAWANRLRREALAAIDNEINARRLFLASPIKAEAKSVRPAIRRLLVARYELATTRDASSVIERRGMLA